jgi:DNA-binding MarR family transcriptional regulator
MPDLLQLKEIAAECPGFQARATARAITRFFNTRFRPLDVTAEQFSLLIGIETGEGITVADLAAQSGVDATTLSRNVQNLEKRKLVRGVGRGRAGKRLELTRIGRSLLGKAVPLWQQAYDELTAALGKTRLRSANRAMRAVADAASLPDQ